MSSSITEIRSRPDWFLPINNNNGPKLPASSLFSEIQDDAIISTLSKKEWRILNPSLSTLCVGHFYVSNAQRGAVVYQNAGNKPLAGQTAEIFKLVPDNASKKALILRLAKPDAKSAQELIRGQNNLLRLHTPETFVKHIVGLVDCYKGTVKIQNRTGVFMNELSGNLEVAFSLPIEDKIKLMEDLLKGLSYCHSKKFQLGDIKKENILVNLQTLTAVLNDIDGGRFLNDPGALAAAFLNSEAYMNVKDLELLEQLNPSAFCDESNSDTEEEFGFYSKGLQLSDCSDEDGLNITFDTSRSRSNSLDSVENDGYGEVSDSDDTDNNEYNYDQDSVDQLQMDLSLSMDVLALGLCFKSLLSSKGFRSQDPLTADEIKSYGIPTPIANVVNGMLCPNWKERPLAEKAAHSVSQYRSK